MKTDYSDVRPETLTPLVKALLNKMKSIGIEAVIQTPLLKKYLTLFAKTEYSSENIEALEILYKWISAKQAPRIEAENFDEVYGLKGTKELNTNKKLLKAYGIAYRRTVTVDKDKLVESNLERNLWNQLKEQIIELKEGLEVNFGDTLFRASSDKSITDTLKNNPDFKQFVAQEYAEEINRREKISKRVRSTAVIKKKDI